MRWLKDLSVNNAVLNLRSKSILSIFYFKDFRYSDKFSFEARLKRKKRKGFELIRLAIFHSFVYVIRLFHKFYLTFNNSQNVIFFDDEQKKTNFLTWHLSNIFDRVAKPSYLFENWSSYRKKNLIHMKRVLCPMDEMKRWWNLTRLPITENNEIKNAFSYQNN